MLKSYLKEIFEVANQGDAREESYYSALEVLFKEYAESIGKKNIHVTTLPKKTEAGNPDFRIWDGNHHTVDGKPLGEKNPKWLQDDYVKFIRFAQWKIDQDGEGVLGFIANHSYLDNPTFRGMRQSLMNSFNEVYILRFARQQLKKRKMS